MSRVTEFPEPLRRQVSGEGKDIFKQALQGAAPSAIISKDEFERIGYDDFSFEELIKGDGSSSVVLKKTYNQIKVKICLKYHFDPDDSEKLLCTEMSVEEKNIASDNFTNKLGLSSESQLFMNKDKLIAGLSSLMVDIYSNLESAGGDPQGFVISPSKNPPQPEVPYNKSKVLYQKLLPAMRAAIKKELLSRCVFANEEKIKDLPQYMSFAVPVDTSLDYILHAVNQETRTEKGGGKPGHCVHAEENVLKILHNNIEQNNGNGAPNSDKRRPGFSKEGSRSGVIIFRAKGFKQPLMDLWKKYKNLPFPGEAINECIAKIGIYKGEPCAQCGAQINVHALENYLKDSRV